MSQLRLLARAFFARFFDNELVSSAIELRQAQIFVLALLAMPGAFLAVQSIGGYMWISRRTPWLLERLSWQHKLFFITYSMLIMGVAAIVVWDSLTIDRRDAMILGPLPIRARTIVAAKLAALLAFLLLLAVTVNAPSAMAYAFDVSEQTTFGLIVRGADARAHGLKTIDDAVRHAPRWRAAAGSDFLRHRDGYAGLAAAYGLRFSGPPRANDRREIYQALADGQVDLIAGDTTVRGIRSLDLVPLVDNRYFFSPYGRGILALFRAFAALLLSTVAAAAWVFTTLIWLQGVLSVLPRRARSLITIAFQSAFITSLFCLLVLMPAALRATVSALGQLDTGAARTMWLLPPVWFLALNDTLAGSARPMFHDLASVAAGALAVSTMAAAAVTAGAYLRQLRSAVEAAVVPSAAGSVLVRARTLLLGWIARTPGSHAVLTFIIISMARSRKHQLLLAAYAGAGVALVMAGIVHAARAEGVVSLLRPRVVVLWAPLVMILWLSVGLRAAFRMPTELEANWAFHLNAREPASVYTPATRSAAALIVLAPILLVSLVVYSWLFGWIVAVVHVAFCGLLGAALLEVLLVRFDQIPFTRAYAAGRANVRAWWPFYILGLEAFAHWPVRIEMWMLQQPSRTVVGLAAMTVGFLALRWRCRRSLAPDTPLEFEVSPERAVSWLELSV